MNEDIPGTLNSIMTKKFPGTFLKMYAKHASSLDKQSFIKEYVEQLSENLSSCKTAQIVNWDENSQVITLNCNGRTVKAKVMLNDEAEETVSLDDTVEREAEKRNDPRAKAAVQKRQALRNQMINKFESDTQKLQQTLK